MKRLVVLALVLTASFAVAESEFQVGLSTHATGVDYDSSERLDDQLYGYGITGLYAHNDHVAVRALLYSGEHEDYADFDNSGFEGHVLVGRNLASRGFRIYGLAGVFDSTWETPTGDYDFSGLTVGFGLGYTWEKLVLDVWGAWRDPGDWEDDFRAFGMDVEFVVTGAGIALTYRL